MNKLTRRQAAECGIFDARANAGLGDTVGDGCVFAGVTPDGMAGVPPLAFGLVQTVLIRKYVWGWAVFVAELPDEPEFQIQSTRASVVDDDIALCIGAVIAAAYDPVQRDAWRAALKLPPCDRSSTDDRASYPGPCAESADSGSSSPAPGPTSGERPAAEDGKGIAGHHPKPAEHGSAGPG